MDGIGILLKALGIEINPDEVKLAVEQAKVLLPAIAQQFEANTKTLTVIQNKLEDILSGVRDIEIRLSKTESYIPGKKICELCETCLVTEPEVRTNGHA